MPWFQEESESLDRKQVESLVDRLLDEARSRKKIDFRRVLLLPPDLTRMHSGAGWITEAIYNRLPKTCAARSRRSGFMRTTIAAAWLESALFRPK
jgi:hypothetical protein